MASIVVIALVLFLDIFAFVLAIGAEQRRSTADVSQDGAGRSYCVYTTDASTWYGVGALALLLAGQAIAMAATRCFCCGRALSPGRWRAFSGVCFIICWLTFLIAELCLLAGSVRNAYHTSTATTSSTGRPAAPCCARVSSPPALPSPSSPRSSPSSTTSSMPRPVPPPRPPHPSSMAAASA
uniref:Uncharacterized protein n=1 Tax=Avena sativa TaxID=4498 RepID=A0ACD5YV71_AVESA